MSEAVEKIRAAVSLPDLVREAGVELKPAGADWKGLCPFHAEKTPSFLVHPDRFKCFGCGQGGDVFTFIMLTKSVDFVGALRWLSEKTGIPLDEDPKRHAAFLARRRREEILEKYVAAAEMARDEWDIFYHKVQLNEIVNGEKGPANKPRKPYLTKEVCERWRIGRAPTLAQCLNAGLSEEEMRSVGLLCGDGEDGRKPYMFFRDRFIIPFLERGRVVHLCGRAFEERTAFGKELKKMLYLKSN